MVDLGDQLKPTEAVIGGIAVRVHSIPGATSDVGLVFSVNLDVLRGFFSSVAERGCPLVGPFQFGWRDDVSFTDETTFLYSVNDWLQQLAIEDRKVRFVSADDLSVLIFLPSRPHDLSDVGDMLFMLGQLDNPDMTRRAEQFRIRYRLRTALASRN